ncbi:hypothetical protein JCGZ_24204 [Jatropha curcas]|uniref:Thioredoxin domain-containing protein n=1 Tax=Jatropha curcas TaxID=180498 RepID=A0A067L7U4_JATCU|nr:hypothetical protein JCGZ_24204 [Jatropha curcas]
MLYFNGCPSCSKILKEGDDLKAVLLMDESIVTELEGNGQDLTVPAHKPSVLLFVDRFSDSSETKRSSNEALGILRKLALQYQISDQSTQDSGDKSERSSVQAFQEYSTSAHPRLKLSPMAQKIKLKEKMSVVIVNEGNHAILENFASDSQGSSLQEVLAYLLQQKKEAKLSSVAKEVGFQLLSEDIDIKLTDKLPSEPQIESTEVSAEPIEEGLDRTIVDLDEVSASNQDRSSPPTNIKYSSQDEQKRTFIEKSRHLPSVKPDQIVSDDVQALSGVNAEEKCSTQVDPDQIVSDDAQALSGVNAEEKCSTQVDQLEEEQLHFQNFKGSFFFSDGNYRLLKALTGGTRIPSLVIIDPLSQQHYVFAEEMVFNYSPLKDFLYSFLKGTLIPYQRSDSELENPREGSHPPFVNMDFHEANSIPQVTSRSFSEQFLGSNQSNDNVVRARKEDVLVLFSNSWCGFCQRMELIVRDVYRAIKGYGSMLKTGSSNGETVDSGENMKSGLLKFPKIYLMDCTLNDCSLILKSINQRDVYPTLLLFPAERKAAVPYDGDLAVVDVIKFIADHGSSSQHLTSEKGILWSIAGKGSRNHFKDALPTAIHEEAPVEKDKSQEVLLKNRTLKKPAEYSQIRSRTSKNMHETIPHIVVGSILVATEKISTQPFDKSQVLIVKADQRTGFQGLIYNKLIKWDSLDELEQGLELLKEAPLSFGGPLIKRGMPFVALTRRIVNDQYPEIVPGIYFLDQLATLHEIEELKSGNQSVSDYWFFMGFSKWVWNQLFDEIAEGAWFVSVNKTEHLDWP